MRNFGDSCPYWKTKGFSQVLNSLNFLIIGESHYLTLHPPVKNSRLLKRLKYVQEAFDLLKKVEKMQ